MKKRLSLKEKYVFLGMLLILVSIIISIGSSLASELILLRKKAYDNSVVMLDVAADTMNTVLDHMVQNVNSIGKLDAYRQVQEISTSGYALDYQISQLTGALNNMVMTNSDIEVIAVDYSTRIIHSSFNNESYYRWIGQIRQNTASWQGQDYQLLIEEIDGQQRLTVAVPMGDTVIYVLFSKKLEDQLDFLEKDFSIRQNEVEALLDEPEEWDGLRLTKPLKLQGWEISCSYKGDFLKSYSRYLLLMGVFFATYLAAAYFVLKSFSNYIFDPVRSLCRQVVELDAKDLSSRIRVEKRAVSFSWSVLFSYMALSFLSVLIIVGSSYLVTQNVIRDDIGNIVEKNIDILSRQTDMTIQNFSESANEIVLSQTTQEYLLSDFQKLDMHEFFDIQQMKNVDLYNLAFYDLNGVCRYSSMYRMDYAQQQLPELGSLRRKQIIWHPADSFGNSTIRVMMPVISTRESSDAYGRRIGYMVLDYLDDPVASTLRDVVGTYGGYGEIITVGVEEPLYSVGDQKPDMIVVSQALGYTDWTMNLAIPHNQYYAQAMTFVWVAVVILVVLCLFILASSYLLYRYLLVNVNAIKKVVRQVDQGDLDIRFSSEQQDEVYALGESINRMLERINQLIVEKYVIELRSREIELNLLQSQLNPHFLCNTLRTIEYMVATNDSRTTEIIRKLMYLFRRCTEIQARLVPLEEELKYIAYYVDIQKVRFGNKFHLVFSVPEEVRECHVLQFILQPVVENAIYHGFRERESGGILHLSVAKQDGMMQITVKDNGEGMDGETLTLLQQRLAGAIPSKSVGLINVHDRLRLYYGEDCGISITSEKGNGTTVTLTLKEQ